MGQASPPRTVLAIPPSRISPLGKGRAGLSVRTRRNRFPLKQNQQGAASPPLTPENGKVVGNPGGPVPTRRRGLEPTGKIDGPTMAALDLLNKGNSTGQRRRTTASAGTAARQIPRINFEPSCKAAAAGTLGLTQDINICVQEELNARARISELWNQFRRADRANCTGLATMGGSGTYTELLTCLEIMRDARQLAGKQDDLMGSVTR